VVVLDQDGVVETEAVIGSAAAAHRVFLQSPQARGGLARIGDDRAGPLDLRHIGRRQGGDAREPAKEVQGHALARQKGAGVASTRATAPPAVTLAPSAI